MMSRVIGMMLVLAFATLSASAMQTTIWVDAVGGDDGSPSGSQGAPYATISKAIAVANGAPGTAYIIKVVEGDYTQAHEDDFGGYPLSITNPDVRIEGAETLEVDYPRLGGDVEDGSIRALFEVVADSADLTDITIKKVRFVAENTANEDSPSAVYAENSSGWLAGVILDNCIIERSVHNDSGRPDRASVVGVGGDSDNGNAGLYLSLVGCKVTPNVRGGVVKIIGRGEGRGRCRR